MNRRLKGDHPTELEEELDKLKARSGAKVDLKVVWIPRPDSEKEGEVVGNIIFVYSQNIDEALETLRHEFVDFVVSSAIAPYMKLANVLLSTISEQAYNKKEEAVETLLKLLAGKSSS